MNKIHPTYFNARYLKKDCISYRQYQVDISNRCLSGNSLVVIPTGLGKTIIGLITAANRLLKYNWTKILVLAPTRPLVHQHYEMFSKFTTLPEKKVCLMTGKVQPPIRMVQFQNTQIIISTPQVIKNDILRNRYDLSQVSLIIFDEAHKARHNYAYTFLAEEYIRTCKDPLILALSASPGKNFEIIQHLCDKLFIENVLYRTEEDVDVKEYIFPIEIFTEYVDLPIEFMELSLVWESLFKKYLSFFLDNELLKPKTYYTKMDFLSIAKDLTISLKYENECLDTSKFGEISDIRDLLFFKNPRIIDIVRKSKIDIHLVYSMASSCISLLHGKDLLETQDITLYESFLETIVKKANNDILSAKRILNSENFQYIFSYIQQWRNKNKRINHPKIEKTLNIITKEFFELDCQKVIIFSQYREMVSLIKRFFDEKFEGKLRAEKFIGQAMSKKELGYSQKKQIEILNQFRNGDINVLIATSVAEEGLDIPNVDTVIFYEPIPSEIRLIQRRGRTGRKAPGRCYILITKYTVDEPYNYISLKKENTMLKTLISSEDLQLTQQLNRNNICRPLKGTNIINFHDLLREYREKKNQEYKILAKRSIDQIIDEIDSLANSVDSNKFRELGVTLYSDIYQKSIEQLTIDIEKIKSRLHKKKVKEKKKYVNKNVKTLINIVKTYGDEKGIIKFDEFNKYAENEEITGKKFYQFFNNACYLGYIKKQGNKVVLN